MSYNYSNSHVPGMSSTIFYLLNLSYNIQVLTYLFKLNYTKIMVSK
jgi:hypothetical protein